MIFYFSATGNGKYVATKLAHSEQDEMISIADAVASKNFSYELKEHEKIGFVIPTYFYGIPTIVHFFLKKLELINVKGAYIYYVLTCGKHTASAGKKMQKILKKKGYHLSAMYGVAMVDNYVPMFKIPNEMKIKIILDESELAIEGIVRAVHNCAYGDQNDVKGFLPDIMSSIIHPFYIMGRKTKAFKVTKECVSCSQCEQICPTRCIEIKEGTPIWRQKRCVYCLACLHRCPTSAIRYKKLGEHKGRYYNPYIES